MNVSLIATRQSSVASSGDSGQDWTLTQAIVPGTRVRRHSRRYDRNLNLKIVSRNVNVYYGDKHAIKNVSLDIGAYEVIVA